MFARRLIVSRGLRYGSPFAGGYYGGKIWDTVCSASGSAPIATGQIVLTLPGTGFPLYAGQEVRVASGTQSFLQGYVVSVIGTTITLDIRSTIGSGTYTSWTIAARWRLIVAPKDRGDTASVKFKTADSPSPSASNTATNGLAATITMNSSAYPAAYWIMQINAGGGINGYTDWYIPARDEMEVLYRYLKPTTEANNGGLRYHADHYYYGQDANFYHSTTDTYGINLHSDPPGAAYTAETPAPSQHPLFRAGGAECFETTYYNTASQSTYYHTWRHRFSDGAQAGRTAKTFAARARAIRRMIV